MKHIIIGTAGHVDHGKTSLIKALTDIDCDTHKEEKRRGITINLGFSYLKTKAGHTIGIVDVPGHKDFINTMVGGACGIDMVLLVIAADKGIMPQTIEHLNIISALGIKKGVVVLTKIDAVDEELAELARLEITEYLKEKGFEDMPIVGVSSVTKQGLSELFTAIEACIENVQERPAEGLFRMYIDRIFTVKGIGSVVTGSVISGTLRTGQEVFLLPGNFAKLRVRSIERHGETVEKVRAGDRAAINLIGLKNEDFQRGMLLSDKKQETTLMADACIELFDTAQIRSVWSGVTFISGSFECQARIHILDKDTVSEGESAIVQLHFSKEAVVVNKDRFILRNTSSDLTLGGGFIFDATPLHHKKRTPKLLEMLKKTVSGITNESSSTNEFIKIALKKQFRPFTKQEIAEELNISTEAINEAVSKQNNSFTYYKSAVSDILIDSQYDAAIIEKIVKILSAYHKENPLLSDGLKTIEINGKIGFAKIKHGKIYVDLLLHKMKDENKVDFHQNTWIIKGHKAIIDNKTQEEIDWLENLIKDYQTEKPVMTDIEAQGAQLKIPPPKIKKYLSYLSKEGKVRFSQNDFIHNDVVNTYRPVLLEKLRQLPDGMDIETYKTLIGGSKRFRALLADILKSEKIIDIIYGSDIETKLMLTEAGKKTIK